MAITNYERVGKAMEITFRRDRYREELAKLYDGTITTPAPSAQQQ